MGIQNKRCGNCGRYPFCEIQKVQVIAAKNGLKETEIVKLKILRRNKMGIRKFDYQSITIKDIDEIMKIGCFTEIICDADHQTIGILEEEYIEVEKIIKEKVAETIKPIAEAFAGAMRSLTVAIQPVIDALYELSKSLANKKISKKKFIKLLRSAGMQRNEINKIVKNNKEKYTYSRYYNIVSKLQKTG